MSDSAGSASEPAVDRAPATVVTAFSDFSAFSAAEPDIPADAGPVLAELCRAAASAARAAWRDHSREDLLASVGDGADGTPTFLIDELVEAPLVEVARRHRVNLVSEEIGVLDHGSARTVFLDPLDGSANAAAGVPLSCFSGALVEDDTPIAALTCWLENGTVVSQRAGQPSPHRTTGRRALDGAAVSLLRPKPGEVGDSTPGWLALAARAARVRILSTSCLEAMLVTRGAIDAFADPGSDTHRIVDLAAAMLLVPAAGGAVVDAYGRPLEWSHDLTRRWSGIVAATPALAEEIADELQRALPRELGELTVAGRTYRLRRALPRDAGALAAMAELTRPAVPGGPAGPLQDADREREEFAAAFARVDRDPSTLVVVAVDGAEGAHGAPGSGAPGEPLAAVLVRSRPTLSSPQPIWEVETLLTRAGGSDHEGLAAALGAWAERSL